MLARVKSYILSAGLVIFIFWPGFIYPQGDGLFEREEVFTITLAGNLIDLLNDRSGKPQFRPVTLSYHKPDCTKVSVPIRVRTRGNFRRIKGNCSHPPLLLNFSKQNRMETIFSEQNRLKLVMPCQGERYVLQEYYVYKVYNLVSPKSFRARLVKVVLDDPNLGQKDRGPFYGFFLEEEDQMASRNNSIAVDRTLVRPEQTNVEDFLNMAVFQYLIGNTDWSVQYRQNIKLIASDTLSRPSTVPYDFDHAGIVRAPYAKPAEELRMGSTRQRRYRGYCITNMEHFENVIAHYNEMKEEIYSIYTGSPFLNQRYIRSTIKYLDRFYKTINHFKKVRREFQYPCRDDGTGNVVIKGLSD